MESNSYASRRAFAGALLAGAAACKRSGRRTIGVIPQGQSHLFWQSIHAGAAAGAQASGVDISWNGPPNEGDFNGQLKIFDAMINRRLDAICVSPGDRKVFVAPVERAAREGIPVVIFDTGVDTDTFVAQVATDNYGAGQMAARRLGTVLNGRGSIVIVAVMDGIASTMAREKGFEDVLRQEFPGIRIADKRYGMADFAKSLQVAENMLTAHPDLQGMFASNESSTLGAAQALRSRGARVKLVGFDWGPTLLEGVRSGLIDSLVVQDPFRIGQDSVRAAVEKLNGGTPRKIQTLPPRLVTAANLDDPAIQKQLHPDLDRYLKQARAARAPGVQGRARC